MVNGSVFQRISVAFFAGQTADVTATGLPCPDPAPEITFGGIAQFTNDNGNLSDVFKIELNRANAIRFGKHILSPESPGNRPPPQNGQLFWR